MFMNRATEVLLELNVNLKIVVRKMWLEMSARRDAARKRVLRQLDVPMPLSAAD